MWIANAFLDHFSPTNKTQSGSINLIHNRISSNLLILSLSAVDLRSSSVRILSQLIEILYVTPTLHKLRLVQQVIKSISYVFIFQALLFSHSYLLPTTNSKGIRVVCAAIMGTALLWVRGSFVYCFAGRQGGLIVRAFVVSTRIGRWSLSCWVE